MNAPRILVDADACPVKDEIYKVAYRREVPVTIVANNRFRVPVYPLIDRVVVNDGFDAADDWIADQAGPGAVVVTADILLADRGLKAGAQVLSPTGRPFTNGSIGAAIATRAIMADLRAGGDQLGGPAAFAKADRSRFLQALDAALTKAAYVRDGSRRPASPLFRHHRLASIPSAAFEAGTERMRVDLGLEKDRARRFALWSLLFTLGVAPDLDVTFKDAADRDAARTFMEMAERED